MGTRDSIDNSETYHHRLDTLIKLYLMIRNNHIKVPFKVKLYGYKQLEIRSISHIQGRIDELCDILGIKQVNIEGMLDKEDIESIKTVVKPMEVRT